MPENRHDSPTLVLVRHGETAWSRLGRHTGHTDVPLTGTGERQAEQLGVLLRRWPITRTVASPLQRALRTAELAGLPAIETDAALVERDYGGYEGLTYDQIRSREPGWDAWTHDVPPSPPGGPGTPGESIADVAARVDALLARLVPQLPGPDAGSPGPLALVGHGHTLRILAARWCGLDGRAGAVLNLGTGAVGLLGSIHTIRGILAWNLTR